MLVILNLKISITSLHVCNFEFLCSYLPRRGKTCAQQPSLPPLRGNCGENCRGSTALGVYASIFITLSSLSSSSLVSFSILIILGLDVLYDKSLSQLTYYRYDYFLESSHQIEFSYIRVSSISI